MSCDVVVMSEAGVKLYRNRLTKTKLKLERHHLVLAVLWRQVTSPANQVISVRIYPAAG